jgi:dTDP-4-amino-4,6-dideoxygalactose transaminase
LGAAAGLAVVRSAAGKPAVLGGDPVRKVPFPSWPVRESLEEENLLAVVRSGKWGRGGGSAVERFEKHWAERTGAKGCLAVANGTSALSVALHGVGVEAGDEVIVPPYTFVATVNAVLEQCALPVFSDTDPDTFQMDLASAAGKVGRNTRALLPVHLGGNVADLDAARRLAADRELALVEDCAQAHLAAWKGRHVGTFGRAGCFSFQASKNLNSGEGGAVISNDEAFLDRCYAFHNNSRPRALAGSPVFRYEDRGLNLRLTEFQGALLLAQASRLEAQSRTRETNAEILTKKLEELPGLRAARRHAGCTRNAYHLYMFRYRASEFSGLPKARFVRALAAEGIPASGGYSPLNQEPFLKRVLESRGYRKIYGPTRLKRWFEENQCPQNDTLCQEAVWLTQTLLLGTASDMGDIARAVEKIHSHAADLARA